EQPLGEDDLDDLLHRFGPRPVALQLDSEGDPAGRLSTCLNDTLQASAVGLDGGAADRVDDRVDLIAFPHRVERGKRHADLSPQGADDELAPARRSNRAEEIRVFPGI